ncbi:MAG TPA: GIY-YIG nuclease family protein [Patescibacteria group bacterium]|nr:GIY-YIG nuclease family protein [Patescibacteria group bacterium]
MGKRGYVYLLTNAKNTVIYTGVTNDLRCRIEEHKYGQGSSFTAHYRVIKLVYYEEFATIYDAIRREKQIKAGSRSKKVHLIEQLNPTWKELAQEF